VVPHLRNASLSNSILITFWNPIRIICVYYSNLLKLNKRENGVYEIGGDVALGPHVKNRVVLECPMTAVIYMLSCPPWMSLPKIIFITLRLMTNVEGFVRVFHGVRRDKNGHESPA
jgi:hypothetical protein